MSTFRTAIPVLALFVCLAAAPAPVFGAAPDGAKATAQEASQVAVSLKTWKDSTEQERYGFLVGFMSMLELEKKWQGEKPLPLKQSLVPSWSRGLSDVTLKQIHDTINEYIAANPGDMDRQVVEVMWFKFAQPKVTEKVDDPERVKQVKKSLRQKKG